MGLFVFDYQPFSIVEDKGFKAFVEGLNPSYQLPNRKVLASNYLTAMYEICSAECKEKIEQQTKSVCLTVDIWTSSMNDPFMGVTVHFVDVGLASSESWRRWEIIIPQML